MINQNVDIKKSYTYNIMFNTKIYKVLYHNIYYICITKKKKKNVFILKFYVVHQKYNRDLLLDDDTRFVKPLFRLLL